MWGMIWFWDERYLDTLPLSLGLVERCLRALLTIRLLYHDLSNM